MCTLWGCRLRSAVRTCSRAETTLASLAKLSRYAALEANVRSDQQLFEHAMLQCWEIELPTFTSHARPDGFESCFSCLLCEGLAWSSRVLGCRCSEMLFTRSLFGLRTKPLGSHSTECHPVMPAVRPCSKVQQGFCDQRVSGLCCHIIKAAPRQSSLERLLIRSDHSFPRQCAICSVTMRICLTMWMCHTISDTVPCCWWPFASTGDCRGVPDDGQEATECATCRCQSAGVACTARPMPSTGPQAAPM